MSHLNFIGLESIIPTKRELEKKQGVYEWSKDGYPPHLSILPLDQKDGSPGVGEIFNKCEKKRVFDIAQAFTLVIPEEIAGRGTPYEGPSLADCEKYNRDHPSTDTDIMEGSNIGDKADWYSDARFAQQYLSGVNPCTIETAPAAKVQTYVDEAGKQGLDGVKKLLSEGKDLLIQDYSYFREATGVKYNETFKNDVLGSNDPSTGQTASRYACAPVIIFQLHSDGRLHPLAITLDYRGNLGESVTIFNRRLAPDDKGRIDEKDDWPWRYAKTCAATADWARHEIAVHLVDTHMIEEAIIVATNRTIPQDHLLYQLLRPHWLRTLALNDAARTTLVPYVIARIAGFGPSTEYKTSRALKLIDWSYKNFNFQAKYVPNDLKKRGFDVYAEKGQKYRNYPYATNIYLLWGVIRDFVKTVLQVKYPSDEKVQGDAYISDWCKEIQTMGQIPTFPTITTRDQLIDAVTMCIHTASPQHTAVNYLQEYYYGFVAARPPALCTPLPEDLKTLQAYTEKELTAALPIGNDGAKWKDWLLAAQLPKLLSYKVDSKYTLIGYAKSLYNVNKERTASEERESYSTAIKDAAATFYDRLKVLGEVFDLVSDNQTEGNIEYKVLKPNLTAVSILI